MQIDKSYVVFTAGEKDMLRELAGGVPLSYEKPGVIDFLEKLEVELASGDDFEQEMLPWVSSLLETLKENQS